MSFNNVFCSYIYLTLVVSVDVIAALLHPTIDDDVVALDLLRGEDTTVTDTDTVTDVDRGHGLPLPM